MIKPEIEFFQEIKSESFTLLNLLAHRANKEPNKIGYKFLQRGETVSKITYLELELQAQVIAYSLQSLKLEGERVLLLYPSGLDFIKAFFGCLYAGLIAVPAYPPRASQHISRLLSITNDAKATIALTTSSILKSLESEINKHPELKSLQWLATDTLDNELAKEWTKPNITPKTLAFLQYTSGSTGKPKGVMVSHENLLHNLSLIYSCFAHSEQSQGVIWLPPYHDMGLIGGILQPLYGGFPVCLMAPMDFLQRPLRWLQAISQHQATTSGGPNFAYDLCLQKISPEERDQLDLSSWKVAFTGAETIRAKTLEQFAEYFAPCGFRKEAFYPCYGMAETTLIVTGGKVTDPPVICEIDGNSLEQNKVLPVQNPEHSKQLVGCGQNLPNQKTLIVNPETLIECLPEEVGEIWVSSSSVAQGYWEQPEETKKVFKAYLADKVQGPFLRTGDLGFIRDGELFVTGRIKDLIIIRGQNYYPQDIELAVEKSHPALRSNSGAAFSVEMKGQEKLIIVQEVERTYLRNLNINEIVSSIRQVVTKEFELQVYATVLVKPASIPKTSSGKIQRHRCREQFLQGTLSIVEDWCETPHGKVKFLHLQNEVDNLFKQLSNLNPTQK
ncbi:fatty acyl-AMP ligase [Gloeothece verrucosa]|uniref:AMP-dependent synthetase and ligase n=1 Tax=Gloeothece verrucosa (strain PCC 7822) TaxID=497965 RepID=E0UL85_GLOV7|nr:fatty acyl-AMP ligase [Gloeothece verrucosa]ADN17715.1 AMP-dependent synthetase and ligase [Gloeothece verrucosa PCC 7822]